MSPSPTSPRPLLHGALVLLPLLALVAWAVQDSCEQRRLSQLEQLDRHANEHALIMQGRLEPVLTGARFAAVGLQRAGPRLAGFCEAVLADLLASQTAIVGAAVHDSLGRLECSTGRWSEGAAAPLQPDTWRLQAQPDGGVQLNVRRAGSSTGGDLRVSLQLDAAWVTAADESDAAEVSWPPFKGPIASAPGTREVRLEDQAVARVRAKAISESEFAVLGLPAVAAMLLACAATTAIVLIWLNRRRQRGDSARLIQIAREPDVAELLRPRMSDEALADAAQVIADEQRRSIALSEQLRQARDRLQEVQRAASMGSWRVDLVSGHCDWSDQAYEIFGAVRGEAFDLERLHSVVHPEDRALLIEQRQALEAGTADLDNVHRIERAGGEERVVHVRGTVAARDVTGRPTALVGTVQDVTEAWEASGLSDALARALALSTDPVLMTREHAGIWLWAWSNRAWDRLCEQLQLDGREADHQLFNPATGMLRGHVAQVREPRPQGKVLRLDLELATPQGLRWFEAELIPPVAAPGRAGHGLLILHDRTAERQGAQVLRDANARLERLVGERTAALARSEQQYRVLADLSPQILWQADREGRVVYLNRAWHELAGPREGGWLGSHWMEALHPDDREAGRAAITEGLRTGRGWQARRRLKSRTGAYRVLLGVAAPVLGGDGAVEGWVGVEADITELEQHAARLQHLNAELETFSYTVSHDLRAPVHVVKGFVEALLAGQVGKIDEQARAYLERVLRSARRMDELIGDLLALARLSSETLALSQFDPGELALGLVEAVRERYPGRSIELHTRGAVVMQADRRLFQVLLENLLDNAAKFTAGRPVCRIDLCAQREHGEIVLTLSDNGVGFPQEFVHRLFRPYQRLHSQSEFSGHGIGLATVARIVQLHGGSISAHNLPQGGAVFRIRLPGLGQAVEPDGVALSQTEAA